MGEHAAALLGQINGLDFYSITPFDSSSVHSLVSNSLKLLCFYICLINRNNGAFKATEAGVWHRLPKAILLILACYIFKKHLFNKLNCDSK